MKSVKERLGFEACIAYAHRWLVGIIGGRRIDEVSVGSGTLLSAGRHPVVLTALHVVEDETTLSDLNLVHFVDMPPRPAPTHVLTRLGPLAQFRPTFTVSSGIDFESRDFVRHVHVAPGALDVAIVELTEAVEGLLTGLGPPPVENALAEPSASATREDDAIIAVGIPWELAQVHAPASHLRLGSMVYLTGVREGCSALNHSARGVHLDWQEAELLDGRRLAHAVDPRGVSGGAVWRLRGDKTLAVWAPERVARIAAVPSVVYEADDFQCERCESVADWGEWARSVAAEIARR